MRVIPVQACQNKIDSSKPIKKHKRPIKNIKSANNQINSKKCIFKRLYIIIISISIILVLGAIFFCLFWFLRKKSNVVTDNSIDTNIENINISDENEHIIISIEDLSFNEIESLIESKIIEKNQNILNETKDKINNLLNIFEKTNLEKNKINPNVSFILPDFLKNVTKPPLKIAKSDIELYKRKYEELVINVNNFTNNISQSFKNLSFPLNNIKDEINELFSKFEETLRNLCIPLILFQKHLNIINTTNNKIRRLNIENQIEEYKNETDNLNLLYNELFEYINKETEIIEQEIEEIPNLVLDIQNRIESDILKYNENINKFTESDDIQYIHDNLIDIKSSFVSTRNYLDDKRNNLDEKISNFENEYRNRKLDFEELKTKNDKIIGNLVTRANIIQNDIISLNENNNIIEIPDLKASSIISEHIIKSLDRTYQVIKEEEIQTSEGIKVFISIINVEEKTSLDLLFVMDITGSMVPYLEQVKQNVIIIIQRILNECPGIDINLGYIGYRDILDINNKEYVNINFTKDYQTLQNTIKNVTASGGEGDGPEDVAWAMEMALNKDWKNNARFLIFIADFPCHGFKYHNISTDKYPNPVENRKDIEVLIKELAENDISLFCMKITEYTNIMFNIFGDIYKNYSNCEFKIVSGQNLDDIVVNSAVEVYVSQRNIEE